MAVKKPDNETQEEYRQRIVDMVCDVVISCDKGLDKICRAFQKDNPDFPDETTIRSWLRRDEELDKQYARAKNEQVEKLVEQIIDIADDDSLDMAFNDEGKPFVDHEHIARSKLRVDTRKWIASKLKPKKYGDKTTISGDEENPLQMVHKVTRVELVPFDDNSTD